MALVLADRVRDTTTTTGTGTVTLSGTAPTGYQTFATAIGNANTTYYTINAGFQWEVGIGTFTTSGNTLTRDTVLSSSSAGSLVDFAVGTKDVFVTYPAEKSVNYNESDNVGIGTTAPTRLLSVYDGDAAITKDTASAASSIIYMNKGRGSAGAPANISSGDNLGAVWFNGYSGSGNNNGYGYGAYVGGAADGAVSAGTVPGRLVFATTTSGDSSPTERMRITSAGNVGIGLSPTAKLHVAGTIQSSFGSTTAQMYSDGAAAYFASVGAFPSIFVINSTERMRLDASGNLGLGVTPSAWGQSGTLQTLQIKNTAIAGSGTNAYWGSNWYGGGFDKYISTAAASLAVQTGGQHLWYNAPSGTADTAITFVERMRLDTSGNLGIGNTPGGGLKLDVSGNGRFIGDLDIFSTVGGAVNSTFQYFGSASLSRAAAIYSKTDTGTAGSLILATAQTGTGTITERMRIDSSGNVGIGTTAPNAARLHLEGSAAASGILTRIVNTNATGFTSVNFGDGTDTRGQIWVGNLSYASFGGAGSINYSANSGPHVWLTNYVERMRLDSSGNLGVSATPSAWGTGFKAIQMQNGTCLASHPSVPITYLNSNYYFDGSNDRYVVNGYASSYFVDGYQGGFTWRTAVTGTAGGVISFNERMRITSDGNVGIGTSAPTEKLEVVGAAFVHSDSPSGISSIILRNDSTAANTTKSLTVLFQGKDTVGTAKSSGLIVVGPTDQDYIGSYMAFATRGGNTLAERVRITSAGDVGVGTTAPNGGDLNNVAILNAGIFTSSRGTVNSTSGVPVTIGAANQNSINGTYIVSCGLSSADPVNYSAVSIVSADNNVLRITALQTAANMIISVSGTSIRAQQNSGGTPIIYYSITRVS